MLNALSRNSINHVAYPVTTNIENRCVDMVARLNAPVPGSVTNYVSASVGGSLEAVLWTLIPLIHTRALFSSRTRTR
jgi:glutamate/tyrosine decarboxylase-like PLP-dependent enzyme